MKCTVGTPNIPIQFQEGSQAYREKSRVYTTKKSLMRINIDFTREGMRSKLRVRRDRESVYASK